jgi:hypothetical protein
MVFNIVLNRAFIIGDGDEKASTAHKQATAVAILQLLVILVMVLVSVVGV